MLDWDGEDGDGGVGFVGACVGVFPHFISHWLPIDYPFIVDLPGLLPYSPSSQHAHRF